MTCCVRALVVLPTKDLAFQVFKVFKQYLIGTDLKAIYLGNATLEKEKSRILVEGMFLFSLIVSMRFVSEYFKIPYFRHYNAIVTAQMKSMVTVV